MKFPMFVLAAFLAVPAVAVAQADASALLTTPQAGSGAAIPAEPVLSDRAPRYQLHKGDSFELQFAFSPEFNQTVTVEPDGYIALKSVGTIRAEGLTIPELTQSVELAYKGILHDPIVTVDLKDFEKPYFLAAGQVGKPGKYDLRSDLTVTEGVAIAGGFTEASKHSRVVLFRPGDNGVTEARVINAKKMLNSRNLAEDVHLRPGDMIFVPQNRISKIQKYLPTSSLGLYGYPTAF
jgi:polysaccharide export outer membrane protein